MMAAIDRRALRERRRTDPGEMATLAAVESVVAAAGREGPGLFGPSYAADEAHAALRGLSSDRQFGLLARDFFGRLTRRCLDYFLSRVMADHVGLDRRFPSIRDHHVFDDAMALHCREVSLIIEEFAAGWYGKTEFEGGITPERASGFVHIAFEKVRAELQKRSSRMARA
jgi:hypothetical protein